MDLNDLRTVMTVVALATFLAIVAWAYSGARRQAFEEAARLPIEEDEALTPSPSVPCAAEGRWTLPSPSGRRVGDEGAGAGSAVLTAQVKGLEGISQ